MLQQQTISGLDKAGISPKFPLYGKCDGRFAFTTVDAAFAQSLLPPDLELAPQQYAPLGSHPLLLMFNDTWLHSNEDLDKLIEESHLQLNLHYNEFIIMLPYVQFKDPQYNEGGPFCFLPILYLDSILAVIGGRVFWEFNKQMARFTVSPTEFNIKHEFSDTPYFSADFTFRGEPVIDNSVANFNAITPMLSLPVLEYGVYGYVSSIYSVGYQNAMITPVSLQLTNNTCKYLPLGSIESPGINKAEMGCFNMQYEWTLTYVRFIKS